MLDAAMLCPLEDLKPGNIVKQYKIAGGFGRVLSVGESRSKWKSQETGEWVPFIDVRLEHTNTEVVYGVHAGTIFVRKPSREQLRRKRELAIHYQTLLTKAGKVRKAKAGEAAAIEEAILLD